MVPARWRPWLVRRLPTTSFLWTWAVLRVLMCTLPALVVVVWAQVDAEGGSVWQVGLSWAGILGLFAAIQVPISGGRWRRTLRQRNGLDVDGSPLPDEAVQTVARGATFRNVSVRGPLALLTLVLAARTATQVDRAALPLPLGDLAAPKVLLATLAVPLGTVWWARWAVERSARSHPWATMARKRSVGAVAGEVITLLLVSFFVLQVAVVLGDLSTPSVGSMAVTATLAGVLGLVVVRGRRGAPVGLWDLVPPTGPLLQVEPRRTPPPTPYGDRRPVRRPRPPALG